MSEVHIWKTRGWIIGEGKVKRTKEEIRIGRELVPVWCPKHGGWYLTRREVEKFMGRCWQCKGELVRSPVGTIAVWSEEPA